MSKLSSQKARHLRASRMLRHPIRLRSGFSFAEVMFAVVILGIGFILIMAIFPVATEQARSTTDDAVAAALARQAIQTIRSTTTADDYPSTGGNLQSFANSPSLTLWGKISGSLIDNTDTRYAWVPYYSRAAPGDVVRISILVLRRWVHDGYTPADVNGALMPRGITIASVTPVGDGTLAVQINRDGAGYYQSVTDGCYLMVTAGESNLLGRCLHVNQYKTEDADSVTYTLAAADTLTTDQTGTQTSAAVIGRDYNDPAAADSNFTGIVQFSGPSQDVAVYTTLMSPN